MEFRYSMSYHERRIGDMELRYSMSYRERRIGLMVLNFHDEMKSKFVLLSDSLTIE